MPQIPFFAPTSAGPIAGVASLPASGAVRALLVMLNQGGQNRLQHQAMPDAARALAAQGAAAVRFDYPAVGAGPGRALSKEDTPAVMAEAISWFRQQAGFERVGVFGSCLGSNHALAIAAADETVHAVLTFAMHLRPLAGRSFTRVRAGLAAAGVRQRGLPRGSKVYEEGEWRRELVHDLDVVAPRATVIVIENYATDAADLDQLLGSGLLSPEVPDRLRRVEIMNLGKYEMDRALAREIVEQFLDVA